MLQAAGTGVSPADPLCLSGCYAPSLAHRYPLEIYSIALPGSSTVVPLAAASGNRERKEHRESRCWKKLRRSQCLALNTYSCDTVNASGTTVFECIDLFFSQHPLFLFFFLPLLQPPAALLQWCVHRKWCCQAVSPTDGLLWGEHVFSFSSSRSKKTSDSTKHVLRMNHKRFFKDQTKFNKIDFFVIEVTYRTAGTHLYYLALRLAVNSSWGSTSFVNKRSRHLPS